MAKIQGRVRGKVQQNSRAGDSIRTEQKPVVKGGNRKKGRLRIEVRNRKRLGESEDWNENGDGTRKGGKIGQDWGQGRRQRGTYTGGMKTGVRRGTRGTVQGRVKVPKSG